MKNNKKLISALSGLIAAVLLVIGSSAMLMTTFSWFAKNEKANANGMNITAYADNIKLELAKYDFDNNSYGELEEKSKDSELDFTGITIPGTSLKYKIVITNIGKNLVSISEFGIDSPNEQEETAREVTNADSSKSYYYLGSQMYASLLSINSEESVTEGVALATESGVTNSIALYVSGAKLASNESLTLEIEILFKDTGIDQNNYRNFSKKADGSENCERRLYVIIGK